MGFLDRFRPGASAKAAATSPSKPIAELTIAHAQVESLIIKAHDEPRQLGQKLLHLRQYTFQLKPKKGVSAEQLKKSFKTLEASVEDGMLQLTSVAIPHPSSIGGIAEQLAEHGLNISLSQIQPAIDQDLAAQKGNGKTYITPVEPSGASHIPTQGASSFYRGR